MAYSHRELEIRHDRSLHEVEHFKKEMTNFEKEVKVQRDELIVLRNLKLDNQSTIE